MAALAEFLQSEHLSLAGLPMPVTLRPAVQLSDWELMAFSRRNLPYRIERNEKGEFEIMSPVGFDGAQRELFAGARLLAWAEEHGGQCVVPTVALPCRTVPCVARMPRGCPMHTGPIDENLAGERIDHPS